MSRGRRRWRWLGGTLGMLAVVLLALYGSVPVWLSHAIVDAPNAKRIIDPAEDPAEDPDDVRLQELGVTAHYRIAVGPPQASLALYRIDPPVHVDIRGTILVLHGIRDQKESQIDMGRYLAGLGYRAILLDLRGHGRSTGKYLTYGVVESRDCRQILDGLHECGLLIKPVGAMGFSYGGAVAVQLAAIDPRVVAVVTVSTFASLREVLDDYVAECLPVVGRLLTRHQLDEAVERAGRLANFDPGQADTARAAHVSSAHLLIIHGARDSRIPPIYARIIQRSAPNHSESLILEGEDHDTIMADRSGAIKMAFRDWLTKWMPRTTR